MEATKKNIQKLNRDEKGLTLLEYAAGAAFILVIAAASFSIFEGSMTSFFQTLGVNLENVNTAVTTGPGGNTTPATNP